MLFQSSSCLCFTIVKGGTLRDIIASRAFTLVPPRRHNPTRREISMYYHVIKVALAGGFQHMPLRENRHDQQDSSNGVDKPRSVSKSH